MLRILGKDLKSVAERIHTPVDKTLFIDIDNKSLVDILNLPTTNTYIISNRKLSDLEELITAGYFNIAIIERASQITEKFIANFINTEYYDNHIKIAAQRVTELYSATGAETQLLYQALVALKEDDVEAFTQVMATNLDGFIQSINDIGSMISYCKSVNSSSDRISDLVKKSTRIDSALNDAEQYRNLYETIKTEKTVLATDLEAAKKDVMNLQAQLNSRTITSSDVHNHIEYKTLNTRLETVTAERDNLKKDFDAYKADVEEQAAMLADSSKDSVIKHLRDEIRKLQMASYDEIISSRLPIFQEATTLAAEHLICFKEVRPTVYVNSMIYWISAYLKIRYARLQQKTYLILVLDPLVDQFTIAKYKKHGWSVNTEPAAENHVLITNCFDYSKLKSSYHIEAYDCIICVDRTHVLKEAIKIKRCNTYYLINTTNDIGDYNLEASKCIGFFAKTPAGVSDVPKYRIDPWTDYLCKYGDINRSGKMMEDKIFATIFSECGVVKL